LPVRINCSVLVPFVLAAALQLHDDSSAARGSVGITLGAAHLAQSVPAISPYRYAGPGFLLGLSWQRTGVRSVIEVRLGGTYARLLSSIDSTPRPHDEIGLATIAVSHLRRINPLSSTRVATFLGLRADGTGNFDSHSYGPYYPTVTDGYDYVAFTIAPASRIVIPLGPGTLTQELSVPLAGFADFPWANGSAQRSLRLRAVTIPDLLAFDERLSWQAMTSRRWRLTWAWHLAYLRHTGSATRRYARQDLTATLSTPLGSQ
jgi:hypothetical protein